MKVDPNRPDLFESLRHAKECFAGRKAYKPSSSSTYIDYEEAFARMLAISSNLRAYVSGPLLSEKPRQGRVGILLNNCPAFLNCFWCASALRSIAVTLNNRYGCQCRWMSWPVLTFSPP